MINFKLKEFLRKHSFPGLHLLPHLQQLRDSFLLHFSLLHWLFPGQGTQLTELNFIPLQVPTEYKLKWPLCKNVKSKWRFCDNLQCPNSETTWLKKGKGNQTKNALQLLGIFTEGFFLHNPKLCSFIPLPSSQNLILLNPYCKDPRPECTFKSQTRIRNLFSVGYIPFCNWQDTFQI